MRTDINRRLRHPRRRDWARFLAGREWAEANAAARIAALGGRPVPTTAIVAETLVGDWLVEIEVIAAG
ncbi:hypothetical protein [Hamadaea tsunoensis]|uniref:hypothetical protein n=1 Tax=Hamadaea tsunoensis TaxID=53368 RepID=UPI0004169976|nr:hypothetical protein [Hamadaea tsunoensis]